MSEILFNRAILWLLMAQVVGSSNMPIYVLDLVCAVFNFWKSFRAWTEPTP